MAMMLLLIPAETKISLDPDALAEFARLGITHVALLHDEQCLGVVVEGWAFDPGVSASDVVSAVAGGDGRPRTLQPLVEMTVKQGDQR